MNYLNILILIGCLLLIVKLLLSKENFQSLGYNEECRAQGQEIVIENKRYICNGYGTFINT